MDGIIGREQQLASLEAFVEHVGETPASLLFEGEAGSGKTTLWLRGCEAARAAGAHVLTARPLEAETGFSFSSIGDLLAESHDAIEDLPQPQARALRIALLLVPAGDAPADERAVGLGLLGVLRSLAEARPVVVAVDDLQWLDEPSARALGFAARRLEGERVGLLVAARAGTTSHPLVPERAFPALTRVEVGPLTRDEVHRLVGSRLAITLSRPALQDVYATSGGNPLYAVELARAVAHDGQQRGSRRRLAVPPSLRDLIGARIATLSSPTRRALLVAAALADPTLDLVSAAIGGDATRAMEEAVDAEVAEISGDRIRFVHPLLAAAAYDSATERARRETHAILARLTREREERARHLALASSSPSEEVAGELEAAAHSARARGAPVVAGELAELAARLTPASKSAAARRRRLDAAFWIFEAGDSWRARAILEPLLEQAEPGAERARILVNLATVRSYDDDIKAARDLFLEAVEEAADDDEIRMRAHDGVAGTSFRLRESLPEGVEHAAEAAALAEALGRDDLLGEALGSKAIVEAILGREAARETAKAALALRSDDQRRRIMRDPAFAVAVVELWHDEIEAATARFLSLVDRARELGDESSIPYLHVMLGQIECVRGRPAVAAELTRQELEHARQAGQETLVGYLLGVEAWACAYAGDETATLELASQSLELADRTNGVPAWFFATSALGQLKLAAEDPAAAHQWLEPLVAFVRRQGMCEPGATWCVGDEIEALVELGRAAEAETLLDWYEGNAERLRRASAQAVARRCRGLLAASRGDARAALTAFEEALPFHRRVARPIEEGRTLLALGVTRRRAKERRAARETLQRAAGLFDAAGAQRWGERTRAELARIGGRAPSAGALTPVEKKVVELVAQGRSNKEVAAALFLSTRTVEGHLSHAYAKLGVRSRVELARRLGSGKVA